MTKQHDLFTDLPRGEQLAALRKLRLQTYVHKGRKVSAAIQKATIRAIDDHQGRGDCFASQSTLADEVGCGTTAIGLAIAALIAQDLITADRPHRMAPNRHRVVWSSVFQLVRQPQDVERDTPSGVRDPPSVSQSPAQRVSSDPPDVSLTHAQRVQNAPLIANLNATNNRDADAWAAVVVDLFRWGLKSAADATDGARKRGWSIEYVRELFIESGGDNPEPEPWQPGQLANWLTGRKPAPFDEAEAQQRIDRREATSQAKADEIRESVAAQADRENRPAWIAEGIVARKLSAVGLERFTTPTEQQGRDRLDDADRRRQQPLNPGAGSVQHKTSEVCVD